MSLPISSVPIDCVRHHKAGREAVASDVKADFLAASPTKRRSRLAKQVHPQRVLQPKDDCGEHQRSSLPPRKRRRRVGTVARRAAREPPDVAAIMMRGSMSGIAGAVIMVQWPKCHQAACYAEGRISRMIGVAPSSTFTVVALSHVFFGNALWIGL